MFIMVLGIVGAILCVGAYALLSFGKLGSEDIRFYILNGVGGACLLVSIAYEFDLGDIGGIVIELCWVCISVFGILKVVGKKKTAS